MGDLTGDCAASAFPPRSLRFKLFTSEIAEICRQGRREDQHAGDSACAAE